jgi:hypothetical protein
MQILQYVQIQKFILNDEAKNKKSYTEDYSFFSVCTDQGWIPPPYRMGCYKVKAQKHISALPKIHHCAGIFKQSMGG